MSSEDRWKAIFAIWIAFAVAAGFSFAGNQETGSNDLWLAVIFALAAVVGSVVVMRLNIVGDAESAQEAKRKRDERSLSSLIDDMDEYELAALRRRLNAVEGEPNDAAALGDLMEQKQGQRNR